MICFLSLSWCLQLVAILGHVMHPIAREVRQGKKLILSALSVRPHKIKYCVYDDDCDSIRKSDTGLILTSLGWNGQGKLRVGELGCRRRWEEEERDGSPPTRNACSYAPPPVLRVYL